ncbi:MAG: enoyl-CoA hydratase/isomerase family protein [Desulfobacterales bacterium]|nr:MAG: enoyl-CoA hydratase/isomerase family protein [Desulfobacterales bacterium]
MGYKTIKFENPLEGVGLITLNRPERLNAINLDMLEELHTLFEEIKDQETARVVIVTGAGRGFCSGADLLDERISSEAATLFSSAAAHLTKIQKVYSRLVIEMRRLPQPIIAAVNGPAAGGGMCLALASDIIIAGTGAAFTPSFINIGLSGGELGSSYFLPRLVGSARAADILMTGRTVDAAEADKIGLISRLVENERLMKAALEIASSMLDKTPLGLRLTKEALNQNRNAPSLEAAVELENRNQSILCITPEFFKAVEKFSQRKKNEK